MAIIPSSTRFVGIAPSVNLTEKKSNQLNSETQPYTMQDFQDSISPDLSPIMVDGNSVGIDADPTVTLQQVAVIESLTTNAGIVLKPNGTGAIMASVPDGTFTGGGNARGQYAVDLKPGGRTAQSQVASGDYSAIIGGNVSTASGFCSLAGGSAFATGTNSVALGGSSFASGSGSVAIGGEQGGGLGATASGRAAIAFGLSNTATANFSNSLGGLFNNATSQYSTVSGGQSNTASTNTHATVVGGQSNTASGQYSVAGGYNNVASGQGAVALGYNNTNGVLNGIAIGKNHILGDFSSTAIGGESNTVSGRYNACLGGINNTVGRFNSNGNINLGGELNSTNATSGIHGITGGFRNTTNADYAIALGRDASATGDYSFAISGTATAYSSVAISGTSYLYGAITKGNPFNATPYKNNAQITDAISRKIDTLSSGGTTVLSLDGTGITNLIIPDGNNRAWNVTVKWVAVVTSITGTATGVSVGDTIMQVDTFGFKKIGGTSSMVGFANTLSTNNDTSMATAAMGYTAGTSQELKLTFTAPTFIGGGSVTCRVVAKVELTEVAY